MWPLRLRLHKHAICRDFRRTIFCGPHRLALGVQLTGRHYLRTRRCLAQRAKTKKTAEERKVEKQHQEQELAEEDRQRKQRSSEEVYQLLQRSPPQGVTIVQDRASAERVLSILTGLEHRYHAWDTEVADIDLKTESPLISNGRIICASFFCGPDIDFGNGPRVWINNLDRAYGTLGYFREYFENSRYLKVWHNYSFDRHILYKHGIDVKGFGGDTMQMARLWDSSRTHRGGYSLEGLSESLLTQTKRTIKDRFGRLKIKKDGTEGKVMVVPELEDLQRDPKSVVEWIDYSTFDTEATYLLREELEKRLRNMEWNARRGTASKQVHSAAPPSPSKRYEALPVTLSTSDSATMWDFYVRYWRPFGELLTDMEREGIKVDTQYLSTIEQAARRDIETAANTFRQWAARYLPGGAADAKLLNPSSDTQIQQLLFAPAANQKTGERMPEQRPFSVDNVDNYIEPGAKRPKKKRDIVIAGLGMPVVETTASGWPAVNADVIAKLAGPDPAAGKYGAAFKFFSERPGGSEGDGAAACLALEQLAEISSIETLLTSFIVPLQRMADAHGRIHASLGLNTETGRLSSRRPNLQNQPALEKDRYKIRNAFTADEGKTLIVADYGQLELRLLAHITKCRSMIDAFAKGGDFHSRTAVGMYPHIAAAIESGAVLLEWDTRATEGKPPPVPLVKDKFATERRRAKTLNFSIAYGKTVVGLAKDWGVSLKEAKETLQLWFKDRPEVAEWQKRTIREARETGYTRTLMGRYRPLPEIRSTTPSVRAHAERAAINTPLQGGAADIVMKAMLLIHNNERLKDLGWKLLLQIHDELILEGPESTSEEALKIVTEIMRNPLKHPLLVELVVDAKTAKTWMQAK